MKKRVLAAAAAITLSNLGPAHAAGPGWINGVTVESVVAVSNGGINFRTNPALSGCTSQSGYGASYASIYPEHPGVKNMAAMLLAAMANDTKISFYLSDATCRVGEIEFGNAPTR
jgi:hypothetical protein